MKSSEQGRLDEHFVILFRPFLVDTLPRRLLLPLFTLIALALTACSSGRASQTPPRSAQTFAPTLGSSPPLPSLPSIAGLPPLPPIAGLPPLPGWLALPGMPAAPVAAGGDPWAVLTGQLPGAVAQAQAALASLPCPMPGLPPEIARLVDCSLLRAAHNASTAPVVPVDPRLLPGVVDHRRTGLIGLMRDQGQVGSCTANAIASIFDTAARRAGRPQLYGSALHLFATYQDPAVADYIRAVERPTTAEAVWPYLGAKACAYEDDQDRGHCATYYGVVPTSGYVHPTLISERHRADGWPAFQVTTSETIDGARDPNQLAHYVASGEPLFLVVQMGANWMSAGFRGSVLPSPEGAGGPHALVLRGYRFGPQGREWLVQNSWGSSWGEGGFAWMTESSLIATQHYTLRFHVRVLG